jgi:hypothetical protein
MGFNRRAALLSAVMITALVLVAGGAVSRFAPGWQRAGLVVVCFFVALEAGFVHYAARRERMAFGELLRYLVPELFVMAVLMRLAVSLSVAGPPLAARAEQWLYDPLSIFEPPFVVYLIVGVLVGLLAHIAMRDMQELAPQSFETPAGLGDSSERLVSQLAQDRSAAIRRIGQRFVLGGVLLLLMLGLEAVNLTAPRGPALPISAASTTGALLYLVTGFLLFSQARLTLLRARWQQEGAAIAEAVTPRWNRTTWLLVLGVVGGTALLPRTYGRGLLETLSAGLVLIGYVFAVLGYLVVWLFGMLVAIPAWLLSLLLPEPGSGSSAPPPPPEIPPPPPVLEREPRLWAALLFWLCMAALVVYAGRIVLQRHPGLLNGIASWAPLARVIGWLAALWRDTRDWAGQAARAAGELMRRPATAPTTRAARLSRLGALAPRELVRYFYRSTLQRAAEGGLSRRAGQTPYEYGAALSASVPDAADDIGELTEAFVTAQYGTRPVESDDAGRVRKPWERLRRALRKVPEQRRHEDTKTPRPEDGQNA